ISSRNQLLSFLQLTKTSMLSMIVEEKLNDMNLQKQLESIEMIVQEILHRVNQEALGKIENLAMDYEPNSLWEMIQKTVIVRDDGKQLSQSSNYELLCDVIDIIGEKQRIMPNMQIIVFENVDHLISQDEYRKLLDRCENLTCRFNLWCVFCTSLVGYIQVNKKLWNGIALFGQEMIRLPEEEHLIRYLEDNWPYNRVIDETELFQMLQNVAQELGNKNNLREISEIVLMKLFNVENMIDFHTIKKPNNAEIMYLFNG
ncbi:MAG: hypothetical protein K6G30_09005, partial [Acetatifactor sp.]|nr:hypothetical protein [Acetatifactor sp.]